MEALVVLGPSTQGHDHPLNGVALDAAMPRPGFLLAQAHARAVEVVHNDASRRRCASATVVRFTTREGQRWTSR